VQTIWSGATAPLVAWFVHGVVLWAWHIPGLYQKTLESDFIHALQHLSFLVAALLFWWSLIHCRRGRRGYGAGVALLFTTAIHMSILGALLAVAPSVWYPIYSERTLPWGLTPLEDQQLAGLIMWVPAGIVYLGASLAMFALWIRESDRFVRSIGIARLE